MNDVILELVKSRLGRTDTSLDEYLTARIEAAVIELDAAGIHVKNDVRDNIFVADIVCWQYSSREKPGPMPEWLRDMRRDRRLQEAHNDT